MILFQFKPFSFINCAIKRIVEYIKVNAKRQCFFVNLTNATFWMKTPRGQEILEFFKRMPKDRQKIEFFGCFDIFVVGFHNGTNAYISMTADPSSRNFEKTLWVSISKGYNLFSHYFSGRATPLGDLRSSIGSTPVQEEDYTDSTAGFQYSSMGSSFHQGFSTFGAGPERQQVSQPFHGFGGPTSGFSLFSEQPPSFGAYFRPIAQEGSTNPFTLQQDFIPVQPTNEPVSRKGQTLLKIRKGRIVSVEIPSACSSGPSTSSTVGIAKSPKTQTPVATTITNLEKKVARLKKLNPVEGSSDYLELVISQAKLEKMRNSL
jgi:hypothetical protein